MDPQLGALDANIGHVQSDVSEIKIDQRRAADKLDAMNGRLDVLRDKVDAIGTDANKRIDGAADKLTTHLESLRKEISADVNALRSDTFQKIDTMRGELFVVKTAVANAKVWTLSLQITIAASLLAVMAHGFKWL
jgi:F0F1-type ATP synthase membrane subunit b/b'